MTYTFTLEEGVAREPVRFMNRFGIQLAGDLYYPPHKQEKYPAIIVSGAFGAVKEQTSGYYANILASYGFVTLAFDNAFTGESGGDVRNVASPEMFTEDFSAAVDFLGVQENIDAQRIGVMAICGLSGMAITAALHDLRIKAVATASMYDMSRSISQGYMDSYTPEDKEKIMTYIGQQRWTIANTGTELYGPHEIMFDEQGNVIVSQGLPDVLPDFLKENPVVAMFHHYYKTPRGYHPRSVNSTGAWTATTAHSFFNFPLMYQVEELKQPLMLVVGENAHSRYYSEDVAKRVGHNAQVVVVPGADHCDLYDNREKIPFAQLVAFFKEYL